jgi:hypothetical protein
MIRAFSFLCALLLMTLPITPAWAETADNQSTLIADIVEAPPFAQGWRRQLGRDRRASVAARRRRRGGYSDLRIIMPQADN